MAKKILFVATVDSHIELFHVPFLKMFKEKGWEVHVATDTNKKIEACDKKICLPIKRSPFKLISNIRAIRALRKVMREEKYDIVHCHTPMGGVVARMAAKPFRKNGMRVIYTAHGFHFYKGAPLHFWMMFYPVEKYLAKYTDTLITINEEDYDRARKKFGKRCLDIQYVPGVGIDPKKFEKKLSAKKTHELRASLGLKDDDVVLICVGRLDKNKNQGLIIKAMKELVAENSKYHLLLAGADELGGEYQKLAKKLGVSSNVHFLGFRDNVAELMQISDIAVSASKREGLPMNLVEAAYMGLPIVATDCRGNRDVCKLVGKVGSSTIVKCAYVDSYVKGVKKALKEKKTNSCIDNEFSSKNVNIEMEKIYEKPGLVLIIPSCTDLNRGDQALVLETKHLVEAAYERNMRYYMMGVGDVKQCKRFGVDSFSDILLHPSRKDKKKSNVNYGVLLKVRWGIVAISDLFESMFLLNRFTRKITRKLLNSEKKNSLKLYDAADAVVVKGGGFLHDYSGGLVGIYTIYYHLFHIKLALAMGKRVYIMPNSFGPFSSKITRRMVNSVLDKCELVTARESVSSFGKTNGLGRDIALFPDLAFFMGDNNSDDEKVFALFRKNGIDVKKDKLVAITARPYRFYKSGDPKASYQKYKDSLKELIIHLQSLNCKVLLVVHTRAENQHENDESCLDEILMSLDNKQGVYKIKDDTMNCYDLKRIYGFCDYVIGTRFHSVIFSLQQLVPCIAITYGGNKGNGIMRDMGLSDYAIKMDEADGNKLVETFDNLVNNRRLYKDKVSEYMEHASDRHDELVGLIKGGI